VCVLDSVWLERWPVWGCAWEIFGACVWQLDIERGRENTFVNAYARSSTRTCVRALSLMPTRAHALSRTDTSKHIHKHTRTHTHISIYMNTDGKKGTIAHIHYTNIHMWHTHIYTNLPIWKQAEKKAQAQKAGQASIKVCVRERASDVNMMCVCVRVWCTQVI